MANLNKVLLMGNLTRDPEKRVTPSGTTIVKLGMAVNRRYSTQDGEQREEVTYIDIDAFGRQAEVIAQYCQKGRPLFVEGRLKLDTWQDKTSGENRSKMSVVLENFQFLGSGPGQGGGGNAPAPEGYEQTSPPPRSRRPSGGNAPAASNQSPPEFDDDVPF